MIFIVKLHVLPVCLKISEQLLHAHLLARLVHDPVHLVLKVVEVKTQQIRQGRVVAHCELHPRCLHQLHGGELARREMRKSAQPGPSDDPGSRSSEALQRLSDS